MVFYLASIIQGKEIRFPLFCFDIENHEIEILDGEKVRVTASFGIATFAQDGTSPDDLLVKADERLYKAKWQGKNRVVY